MDSFPHAPPPPYRRTPPHSNESLGEQLVERTNSRPVSTRKLSASAANLGRAGPLGHGFDAFSSTPSPSPSSVHIRTASNSTVQSHADRKRLRITIPETQAVNGPPSPLQPVTVAYLPRSTAGDICSSPVEATFSHWDGQLPNGSAHAFDASYDEAYEGHCAGLPALKTVRFASQDVQYSPRSPPRLARQAYIPLPPEVSEDELDDHCYETPLVASFNMLRLHDDSASGLSAVRGYHGSPINDKIHLMANLPQDADADLLSPLPLTAAPTYRLEDLTEQISRCLYATERMHLSLASSTTKVRSTDVQPICAALTSSFTGIKAEATQSPPDLELLVRAHGAEWRRKYERVILSLDRNMQHFQRILDQVSGRHPQSRHLVTLKDTLVRFARKFEDIECRLRVFHHHISLLEMQAEYRELTVAAREEADAERACRQTYKAISQEVRARRQALKEQIRREEEAVRVRWARQGARWGRGTR
ncbi:hypothetical protein BC835DRAFT_510178 [Cytidiella melzeri]|nr:hypothetical protein BC835DRAFT_510178 [Cytidiella melzeri]